MKNLSDILGNARRRVIFEKNILSKRLSRSKAVIKLYSEEEIKRDPSKRHVKIVPFLIGSNAPTVIVCPGGAYQIISLNNEGIDIAKALNKRGYNAFILIYRVCVHAHFPAPMDDLARAVNFVKHNGGRFGANTDKLYICGSSAGGHLCAYFGARYGDFVSPYCGKEYDLRPSGVILCYPVISMAKDTHHMSCVTLLGKNCTQQEKNDKSVEMIADADYPPTFLWHCDDDGTVPISNSIRFDERLTELGVTHEFCRYPSGGHGIGLGKGTSAEGWIDRAVELLKRTS